MTTNALRADRANAVLADLLPQSRLRDAVLVLGGTAFITVMGQISIPLPFTPVPLSLATFAVLLTGAALGTVRGVLSTGLYLLAGIAGAPMFADGHSGWQFASFGYIGGYILAAGVLGWMARNWKVDRSVWRTVGACLIGAGLVYVIGVPWLMLYLDVSLAEAMPLGVTPFLLGDAVKAIVVAMMLPGTWRLIDRFASSEEADPAGRSHRR